MTSPYAWHQNLAWLVRYFRPSVQNGAGVSPAPREGVLRPAEGPELTLCLFGDLMCQHGDHVPEVSPRIQSLLSGADWVFGNMEAPLVFGEARPDARYLGHFAMSEGYLLGCLERLGVRPERAVLSVANNHIADQGEDGLAETRSRLERLGIAAVGLHAAGPVVCLERGGLRLGVAAWSQWLNSAHRFASGPGIWRSEAIDAVDWTAVRAREGLDALLGFPHWDHEFSHFPSAETRRRAARLAELGFDAIAGHHPHVVQPLELLEGGKLVFYSAGNLSGPALRRVAWPVRLGAILELRVGLEGSARGKVTSYRLHPTVQRTEDQLCLEIHTLEEAPEGERARLEERFRLVAPVA